MERRPVPLRQLVVDAVRIVLFDIVSGAYPEQGPSERFGVVSIQPRPCLSRDLYVPFFFAFTQVDVVKEVEGHEGEGTALLIIIPAAGELCVGKVVVVQDALVGDGIVHEISFADVTVPYTVFPEEEMTLERVNIWT